MSFVARSPALAVLFLAACIPSIVVGDNPQDEPDTTTGLTTTTTGDLPTTTDQVPVPAGCGDGLVDPGEACDDANDEPNDGCDRACQPSGRVEWTVVPSHGFVAEDLALDPAGRILLSGPGADEPVLLALAVDGTELWRKPMSGTGRLAVDPSGRIFLGTQSGTVHAVGPTTADLWDFTAEVPEGVHQVVIGIDATEDAVYTGTLEAETSVRLTVRRHDPATGAVVWETRTPADISAIAEDLAVAGDRVIAVGRTFDPEDDPNEPMLVVFDTAGALLSIELDDTIVRPWASVAAMDDGGMVIAGSSVGDDFILRRLGPDRLEQWTHAPAGTSGSRPQRVAVGPGERIAVVGFDAPDNFASVVRLHDGTGAIRWTSTFASPLDSEKDLAVAAAFGLDHIIVAGRTETVIDGVPTYHGWVRRFALD